MQEKYKHRIYPNLSKGHAPPPEIYPNLSKGHAPPPGQLTEQRTHVFTAVTMAGLQQGENCADNVDDDDIKDDCDEGFDGDDKQSPWPAPAG